MKPLPYFIAFILLFSFASAVSVSEGTSFNCSNGGDYYTLGDFTASNVTVDADGLTVNLTGTSLRLKNYGEWGNQTVVFQTAYNQFFLTNGTTTPIAENLASSFVTIPPDNYTFVFTYSATAHPKFSTIDSSITDINYGLSGDTLEINCTGNGFSIQNLGYLGSTIYVYHDGTLTDTIFTTTYSASSCSRWVFTGSELAYYNSEVKPSYVGAYLALASLLSVFMIGLLIVGVYSLIKEGGISGFNEITFGGMMSFILAVFVVVITIIAVLVFGNAMP